MTVDVASLVTDNLNIWTTAVERKSGAGRGGSKRINLHGIERLRALILNFAVRGKLVPQNDFDEPAAGFLKRLKFVPKVVSRDLPQGWAFAPLTALGAFIGGITPSKGVARFWGDGYPWVSPKDMGGDMIDRAEDQITQAALNETSLQIVPVGSLLMVARSGILRRKFPVAIARIACTINQDMKALILKPEVDARFIQVMLQGFQPRILTELVKRGMTVESLIFGDFTKALWPLPPLAEQQRIVAKVDELMALCDTLEEESTNSMAAHQALVENFLATLVNSENTVDLAANWARLETHFDTLFTTDASIETFKQTILDLAVRGKLVPQGAGDKPASELVQGWKQAKSAALQSAGDRRIKATPDPKVPPFSLPSHWAFQSFENVFLFIDYRGNTPPKTSDGIPLITAKNVRMGYLAREPREFISEATFQKWMTRGLPKVGDLFFTTEAPLGNICQNNIEEPFAIAQRLICFQPYGDVDTRFFMLAIMSRSMQQMLDDHATGMTARGIKAAKLKPLPLPVPPADEQHRIVVKVDELMALCDQLKSRLADAAQIQRHLADAITQRAAA